MNSVELAVVGGHIDLVRDLVDNFKANIDFSTEVCVHVYMGICIYIYVCMYTWVYVYTYNNTPFTVLYCIYHRQL